MHFPASYVSLPEFSIAMVLVGSTSTRNKYNKNIKTTNIQVNPLSALSFSHRPNLGEPRKKPSYFPWNPGWLIWILTMVHYNPYIPGEYNHVYTLNNQVFFHCSGGGLHSRKLTWHLKMDLRRDLEPGTPSFSGSSWYFQSVWKICSSIWIIFPGREKIIDIWNHHLKNK